MIKLKKYLVIYIFCSFCVCNISIANASGDYISTIENKLFNTSYNKDSVDMRLDRIETNVFGEKSTLPKVQRIERLKKIIGITEEKQNLNISNQNSIKTTENTSLQQSDIKYPALSKLEITLYNKTFEIEDIYSRLNRLELTVYNAKSNLSLSERVDRLRDTITGGNKMSNASSPALISKDQALLVMEQKIFNETYINDSVEERLSRLESKMFNSSSPEDSYEERMERISAVVDAQPASELCRDMSSLRQYENVTKGVTIAGIILLILRSFAF